MTQYLIKKTDVKYIVTAQRHKQIINGGVYRETEKHEETGYTATLGRVGGSGPLKSVAQKVAPPHRIRLPLAK